MSRRRVVSMCSLAHREVWTHTSRLLPKFVPADEYYVYVPETEMSDFKQFTGPAVKILSQESLSSLYSSALAVAVSGQKNSDRLGWYLQQFNKFEAIRRAEVDELVIWDADCVPLKPIELFSSTGDPVYMNATEHHIPYFEAIERLLGLSRVQNQSFVIPGFPVKKIWVDDFFEAIRQRHPRLTWFEAIVSCSDLGLRSGFSETETLGTWIANNYPDRWAMSDLKWERRGQSRYGHASSFSTRDLVSLGVKRNLDIVTFENWDVPETNRAIRQIRRFVSQISRQICERFAKTRNSYFRSP